MFSKLCLTRHPKLCSEILFKLNNVQAIILIIAILQHNVIRSKIDTDD